MKNLKFNLCKNTTKTKRGWNGVITWLLPGHYLLLILLLLTLGVGQMWAL